MKRVSRESTAIPEKGEKETRLGKDKLSIQAYELGLGMKLEKFIFRNSQFAQRCSRIPCTT